MSITIWDSMWRGGNRHDYGVGQHVHRGRIGSFDVPEGYRVRIKPGESLDSHPVPAFYDGLMEPYHLPIFGHGVYVLQVEQTDVRKDQLCHVGWTWRDSQTSLDMRFAIPPGTYYGNSEDVFFENDRIEWLEVPDSMEVTVYEHGGSAGSHRSYRQGRHQLPQGLYRGVSTIKSVLDGWKLIAANSDMRDTGDNIHQIGTYLLEGWAANDTDIEQEVEAQLSASREATLATHWTTSAKVTSSVQVSGGVGVAEVTAGLSIELGAEYGEEKTVNRGQAISITPSVKVPPGKRYKCSAVFRVMKGKFPVTRTLENQVTKERITEDGYLDADYAGRYEVTWSDDE